MLTMLEVFGPLVVIGLISLPIIPIMSGKVTAKNAKYRVLTQVSLFAATFILVLVFQINGVMAQASEAVAETTGFNGSIAQGLGFIAAAVATSASALGAGFAVAAAAPAAIGAISENTENFGKAMIFVALAEGVAIYGLLISILIINKL
ncbi:MAG: ATP synthase subunit C [Erysipelotrichaceae bacterium]|jgi:V/A-type H+-transporting ATPase subunit K